MKLSNIKKQAGLAITDLLIWGAGIILVLGIIAGFAGLATDSGNVIDYTTGINNIKVCVTKTLQGSPVKTEINNINLVEIGCIPAGWVDSANNQVVTPEGGIVTVQATSIGNGNDNGFETTVPDVGSATCVGAIPALAANYHEILVNGTVVKPAGETSPDTQQLVASCNNAANTLVFRYIN